MRPGIVPFRPGREQQGPVLSVEQFRCTRSDEAVQAISPQTVAFRSGGNEELEEIPFIGFLMKVAAVRVLKPQSVDDPVDNLLVSHVSPLTPRVSPRHAPVASPAMAGIVPGRYSPQIPGAPAAFPESWR